MKTVKEVCAIAGVTRKTLFYYDRIGLLEPTLRQGEQKHKLYDDEAVDRLLMIRRYRDAGLEINEIRMLLNGEGNFTAVLDAVIHRLQKKNEEVCRQLANAGKLKEEIG